MYIIHEAIIGTMNSESPYYPVVYYASSFMLLSLFALLIFKVERKEFEKLPYVGKYFLRPV
jgi:hypothetical protein